LERIDFQRKEKFLKCAATENDAWVKSAQERAHDQITSLNFTLKESATQQAFAADGGARCITLYAADRASARHSIWFVRGYRT
jgi:hypothetical protein